MNNNINNHSTHLYADCGRTDHDGIRELPVSNVEEHSRKFESSKSLSICDDDIITIYRFKFTETFMSELYQFSKIHQYDDREQFKEAWKVWEENNNELITIETRRLVNLGYEGNILEKMYKSARYYFRKKSTEKKKPIKRCKYHGLSKPLLETMDEHIRTNMKKEDYQPKTGFVDFCKENIPLLREEIQQLCKSQGIALDPKIIQEKIKKTYKNRYFVIVNK